MNDDEMIYSRHKIILSTCNLKAVRNHFPGMHKMAMEEFFVPQKICQEEMVC